MIDYRHYHITNRPAYIDPDTDLLPYNLKRKVYLLYSTLEPVSGNKPMEILDFLATIADAFDGKRMSEGLETRTI